MTWAIRISGDTLAERRHGLEAAIIKLKVDMLKNYDRDPEVDRLLQAGGLTLSLAADADPAR